MRDQYFVVDLSLEIFDVAQDVTAESRFRFTNVGRRPSRYIMWKQREWNVLTRSVLQIELFESFRTTNPIALAPDRLKLSTNVRLASSPFLHLKPKDPTCEEHEFLCTSGSVDQ